jgi:transcription-repair coupling factor (superfamily II helicase)
MVAIGYDLYCRLLDEAVREIKGEEVEKLEATVTTDLDAYLADDYVPASEEKILFYKRLADTSEERQIDELFDELEDRYGKAPEEARNLFELRRVKLRAAEVGIAEVDVGRKRVRFEFAEQPSGEMVTALVQKVELPVEFVQGSGGGGGRFAMKAQVEAGEALEKSAAVLEMLKASMTIP